MFVGGPLGPSAFPLGNRPAGAGTRPGIPALRLSIPGRVSGFYALNASSQLRVPRGLVTFPSFGTCIMLLRYFSSPRVTMA